ncbi:hypothetical protein PPERSA_01306 [Pseudocohnilembus persalinus]|uniref:MORN motif n=1 Tax=Pseudocohnilembus persalinus TaxID=266149 RepID=A0A0V0QGU1_PSEPJ|nr:hypothetical protein PPERSA_01306 [Pseudocohnilembus persalinus]|eukprot:KRX01403.1 hypothetical protein PPERSA_01306 [Pseudocohnilembus persalinus]
MGNLCCSQNQTPDLINAQQDGRNDQTKFNATTPGVPQENDANEVQPEVSKQQLQAQEKAQQHDFPDVELGKTARQRVQQVQPGLIAAIQAIEKIQLLINPILDPSEQIIAVKEYVNNVYVLLNGLNLYWVGLYEVYQKESAQFIQSAFQQYNAFAQYLQQLFEQAKKAQRKEEETEWTSFSQSFQQKEVIEHIEKTFINDFKTYHQQFRGYNTIRCQLNPKTSEQFKINLQGVDRDILSSFSSAYVRFHSKNHLGYTLWDQLFNGNLFVPRELFVQRYSEKCKVEPSKLRFITLLINSFTETINYFDFFDVLNNTPENFDSEGVILPEKISEIDALIEKIGEQKTEQKPESIDADTSKFHNGAIYKGKIVNNLFEGVGTLSFPHYTATGTFQAGKLNGPAKVSHYDIISEGNFVNGLLEGEGKVSYPDGTEFVGNFKNNFYQGKGTLTTFNNIAITGEWVEGKILEGRIVYPNQQAYEGQIVNNRHRHGKGRQYLLQENKTLFEGVFEMDEFAEGKLYKPDGSSVCFEGLLDTHFDAKGTYYYEGGVYNGLFNIESFWRVQGGQLNYSKIQQIEGTWERDAPVKAINYFDIHNKNTRYEGEWKNFNRHGNGQFFYNSGDHYEGQVKNNLRHGQGVYTYKNGDKYTGEFQENDFSGNGTFHFANGDVYVGQFLKAKFHGLGKYTFAVNQNSYQGQWDQDRYNGQGVYKNAKGQVTKAGLWSKDKLVTNFGSDVSQLNEIQDYLKQLDQPQQQQKVAEQKAAEAKEGQQLSQQQQPANQQQQPAEQKPAEQKPVEQQPAQQQAVQQQQPDNQQQQNNQQQAVQNQAVQNQQVDSNQQQQQQAQQQQAQQQQAQQQQAQQQQAQQQQAQQQEQNKQQEQPKQQEQSAPVAQQQSSKEQVDTRKQEAQPFQQEQAPVAKH